MKRLFILVASAALLLGVAPAASQDGRGLVVTHSLFDLRDYIFPHLYLLDPMTGILEGAQPDNFALVLDAQPTAEQEQTLHLRDDSLWSDGTPVSAYEVLYSLITVGNSAVSSRPVIDGIAVTDEHTLTLRYSTPSCANSARSNVYIIPIHAFIPGFTAFAQDFSDKHPGINSIDVWAKAYLEANLPEQSQGSYLAAGLRPLLAERSGEAGRYTNGDLAVLVVSTAPGMSAEEQFLSGMTNLLINPDFKRRADLRAHEDVQIYDAPGWSWDYLAFNFADTTIPRSAYTTKGDLLDQGRNEFFSDKRLRQAVQLGIDVNAIIEVVYQGDATPLAGTLPLHSWGYNPDLQPAAYDPGAAARLLDEAGWVDTDGDGIRNCFRCTTAEPGTSLSLRFSVQPGNMRGRVSEMMAGQLWRIGVEVSFADSDPTSQRFDLYLGGYESGASVMLDPDQAALFTRAADVVGMMGNIGSYVNPALEDLLVQASTAPDCDINPRAALYHEAQTRLADDLPMFGLYARHEMVAARGIEGFDPQPGNPFWNLLNWRVAEP
jgi:peptide/nickel transport system substrate-binding protein